MKFDKFKGCILGATIGDALGMPMETMSKINIQKRIGPVTDPAFLSPSINPKSFFSLRHLPPGSWTDDTQLTLATIEALIESDGVLDMDKIAQKHIEAYQGERRGWGKSTKNSCKRLARGISWKDSGELNGAGNGVMMKIAPLGLLQSVKQQNKEIFLKECITYAKMTHLGTQAIVAGVVHAAAIDFLAGHPLNAPGRGWLAMPSFLGYLKDIALTIEQELPSTDDKISEQIDRILSYWHNYIDPGKTDLKIASRFGNGTSYAYNSFGLSYALFVGNPNSFFVVWQAATAGGDTDSNASIVGSLYGALNGSFLIPRHLLLGLERQEYIETLIERFFKTCNPGS